MLKAKNESALYTANQLYTAQQSRLVDKKTVATGVAGFALMQKAALAAFDCIQLHWPQRPLHIFCGGGNNGGDGLVIATLAKKQGIAAHVYLLAEPGKLKNEAAQAYQLAQQTAVELHIIDQQRISDNDFSARLSSGLIVDALLGTGIQQRPRALIAKVISIINASCLPVFAIDVPSGLNSDSGFAVAEVVKAQATLSFITQKRGLFTADGPEFSGQRLFNDLDAPEVAYQSIEGMTVNCLQLPGLLAAVPKRDKGAHKGSMGHVAIVGGDIGMAGAAILSSTAAARMGAGLTTMASRQETIQALLMCQPEIMAKAMRTGRDVVDVLTKATVVAIGPGLGQSKWAQVLLAQVAVCNLPQVWDADALNLLAQQQRQLGQRKTDLLPQRVITPHPAEAARLLGLSTEEVQQDRFAAAQKLQQIYGGVVVLKGAGSLICWQDNGVQQLALCPYGNPAMATGGMGDVLTGVIAGLLAQQDLFNLTQPMAHWVCLAVCLHGAAADALVEKEGERGLLASDLIGKIRQLLNQKVDSPSNRH